MSATPASAATFAFSDEELLDALTTFGGEAEDISAAFDKPSLVFPTSELGPPAANGSDATELFGGDAIRSVDGALDMPAHEPKLYLDVEDVASTDSSSEQSSLMDHESTTTEQSSPTLRDASQKPTRKRRKHELDAIRALATSLESQLRSLKKRHHPEQPGANMFWKRVADQLLLDRQRATTENARLRDIFQDQTKVLKAIQKSIQKSPDLEKLGVAPAPSPPLETPSSSDIYSRLFSNVADLYPGTESVLEQAGVRQATESKRRVNMNMVTEDGQSVMTMEVSESRTVPFHVADVTKTAWNVLTTPRCGGGPDEGFKRAFKARGDDVFGVCKIECSLGIYTLNADVAVRRFVEGDRMTYVWECVGRCDNQPNPFDSFRLQEKGWVVFEPSPTDPLKKSVFRTCVQFVPKPMDPSRELGTAAKDVGLATEVALSVYEKTIGYIYSNVVAELMGSASLD